MHKKPVKSMSTYFAMGCDARCIVYGMDDGENKRLHQEVWSTLGRIQEIASFYNPRSEINRLPGGVYTTVSEELLEMLLLSRRYHKEMDRFFDISMGTVKALWQNVRRTHQPLSKAQLDAAFQATGMEKIEIKERKVKITDPSLKLDFSDIAKGYAIDACVAILAKGKIHGGLVNVGGDIGAVGSIPSEKGWKVGVRDPRPGGKALGYVTLESQGIATSGNSARFATTGRMRLGHIIDPVNRSFQDGGGVLSVSIVSETCAYSDALATAVFAMGPEKGVAFLEKKADRVKYLVAVKTNGRIDLRKNLVLV